MTDLLTLPRLGETMEEGRVVAWNVAPGDAFRRGDVLLEVETDKTVVEVPALADGVLAEIVAGDGAMVRVGDPIARLAGQGVATSAAGAACAESTASSGPSQAQDPAVPGTRRDAPPQSTGSVGAGVPDPAAPAPVVPAAEASGDVPVNPVRATPKARRLARRSGVDLAAVTGTGRRGRIEAADVAQAHAGDAAGPELMHAHGLACRLTGPDDGTPVVLLHGFAADHAIWSGLAAGLARAGRRVLVVDLPGHGAARADAATPDALSAGLAPLIRDVIGGPAHVLAHSLGAVPAVALAEAGSATSLTLIAPYGLGLTIDRAVIAGLAAATTPGEIAHLLQRMTESPLPLSDAALATIARTLAAGRLRALAAAMLGGSGQAVSLRAPLARLADTLPVRILAPQRDRILDWGDMTTVSPRIAVHHLPRAGHMAAWDAPTDVLAIALAATAV